MTCSDETRVLYNDQCPVCRTEIRHYDRYAARTGLPIRFEDLNATDLAAWGLSADDAARRLHVLKNGRILAGIPAFVALWEDMPKYRWLARVVSLPGVNAAAKAAYDHVLAPLIYRWHLARQRGARVTPRSEP